MPTKRCRQCQLDLDLEAFTRESARPDGRRTTCKACRVQQAAQRSNPELAPKKVCDGCHQSKPLVAFPVVNSLPDLFPDGRALTCTDCRRPARMAMAARATDLCNGWKACITCGQMKQLVQFGPVNNRKARATTHPDGRTRACKACRSADLFGRA